jgi:hypothetical protein
VTHVNVGKVLDFGEAMRRLVLSGVLILCLLASAYASAADAPIPLKPSTGYRDYCAGFGRSATKACPRGHVPVRLWRALAFPPLGSGGGCPVTAPHRITKRLAPVLGSKPVYVGTYGYSGDSAAVEMPSPAPYRSRAYGTGWTIAKIVLVMRKDFRRPLLVRGQRLDGAGSLGFSGPAGRRPVVAMQFPPGKRGIDEGQFKGFGLGVWATAPGCYGAQIDGKTFRRDIVFRIVFSS